MTAHLSKTSKRVSTSQRASSSLKGHAQLEELARAQQAAATSLRSLLPLNPPGKLDELLRNGPHGYGGY